MLLLSPAQVSTPACPLKHRLVMKMSCGCTRSRPFCWIRDAPCWPLAGGWSPIERDGGAGQADMKQTLQLELLVKTIYKQLQNLAFDKAAPRMEEQTR